MPLTRKQKSNIITKVNNSDIAHGLDNDDLNEVLFWPKAEVENVKQALSFLREIQKENQPYQYFCDKE